MSRVHVIRPGMLTTVQDLGRPGWQCHGVTPGGALDSTAMRLANLLVGNPEGAAGLEITLVGPVLRFAEPALIAVCGADFEVTCGGAPVPPWRPVRLAGGSELSFGAARSGSRIYLAVAGGIAVPRVLGGRGTHLAAGFGGFEGRPLQPADILKIGPPSPWARRFGGGPLFAGGIIPARWEISGGARPSYSREPSVRVVRGPQWDWFPEDVRARFLGEACTVAPQSDRMGLRLNPPVTPLALGPAREMISEGVTAGAVQVPPDGRPIVMLADRQTIGGYPKIAVVASVDLPLLAQLCPGDRLAFREVPLAEAQEQRIADERQFATLKQGIALHSS